MNIQFVQYMIEIHNNSIKAMAKTNKLINDGKLSFSDREGESNSSSDRNQKVTQINRDRIHELKRLNQQLTEMLEKANPSHLTKIA
jgi:predicted transglutaminase-like cysteine proteinase